MSFQDGKIVGYLGDNKFVIQLPEEKESNGNPSIDQIQVAHDYVRFVGDCSFQMERGDDGYPYTPKRGPANWVNSRASVTIGIREMIDIVLPFLNGHKYLQQEHLADRIHDRDDEYFDQHGLTEPRWKKGDKYPGYAFDASIIKFYDPARQMTMVSFRRNGEAHWETVSASLFAQIEDSLKLYFRRDEFKTEQDDK